MFTKKNFFEYFLYFIFSFILFYFRFIKLIVSQQTNNTLILTFYEFFFGSILILIFILLKMLILNYLTWINIKFFLNLAIPITFIFILSSAVLVSIGELFDLIHYKSFIQFAHVPCCFILYFILQKKFKLIDFEKKKIPEDLNSAFMFIIPCFITGALLSVFFFWSMAAICTFALLPSHIIKDMQSLEWKKQYLAVFIYIILLFPQFLLLFSVNFYKFIINFGFITSFAGKLPLGAWEKVFSPGMMGIMTGIMIDQHCFNSRFVGHEAIKERAASFRINIADKPIIPPSAVLSTVQSSIISSTKQLPTSTGQIYPGATVKFSQEFIKESRGIRT